jgi:hypothetical protein
MFWADATAIPAANAAVLSSNLFLIGWSSRCSRAADLRRLKGKQKTAMDSSDAALDLLRTRSFIHATFMWMHRCK